MPIKVPNDLPAVETLTKENVFVMTDTRAMTQNIRPLQILILNLMPTKIDTETQLTRLLGNTPLQVELELLQMSTHKSKNTSEEHMIAFYKTFDEINENFYDGMIITGAPVELHEFEEVDYWEELCEIMEWTKTHVHSTFYICWGAQAGLYYHYGINKYTLPKKLSGVYKHTLDYKNGMLFRGFDDEFYVPHSRNTDVRREDIEAVPELKILCSSEEAGVFCVKSNDDRQIYVMGHSEYDWDTLLKEYVRDKNAGLNPDVPVNYFPGDDDTKTPVVKWRSCANLLYSNWLNYFVYQSTPYDIRRISEENLEPIAQVEAKTKVSKFGGVTLVNAEGFKKIAEIVKSDDARRYIVVSAPGRPEPKGKNVTDLLVDAWEEKEAGNAEAFNTNISEIKERFKKIIAELDTKISFDVDAAFEEILENLDNGAARECFISRGEYITANIMAEYLGYDFIDAIDVIAFDKEGNIDTEITEQQAKKLRKRKKIVMPGFYGRGVDGNCKVFPRGGSDISGSVLAEALNVGLYEKWTDVPGVLLANPKFVKKPLTVPVITYAELRALSLMGFKVLHEDTVFPVGRVGIPINIKCVDTPDEQGTLVVKDAKKYSDMLDISGIAGRTGFVGYTVEKPGINNDNEFREIMLNVLEEHNIKIYSILSNFDSLTIVVESKNVEGLYEDIKEQLLDLGALSVTSSEPIAMISIVGRNMAKTPNIAVRIFGSLANAGINIEYIDQGTDRINVVVGVNADKYTQAIRTIYSEFTTLN